MKFYDKASLNKSSSDKKALQNEICMARDLNHENIASLKYIYEGDTKVYCLYDYCEGKNL